MKLFHLYLEGGWSGAADDFLHMRISPWYWFSISVTSTGIRRFFYLLWAFGFTATPVQDRWRKWRQWVTAKRLPSDSSSTPKSAWNSTVLPSPPTPTAGFMAGPPVSPATTSNESRLTGRNIAPPPGPAAKTRSTAAWPAYDTNDADAFPKTLLCESSLLVQARP